MLSLYVCKKVDNLMHVPLETAAPTITNGSESNAEGQYNDSPKKDETDDFDDRYNWQLICKYEDMKDNMDIAYINLGETVKLGEVRYTLNAETAEAPLRGHQLLLAKDGPHADEI